MWAYLGKILSYIYTFGVCNENVALAEITVSVLEYTYTLQLRSMAFPC